MYVAHEVHQVDLVGERRAHLSAAAAAAHALAWQRRRVEREPVRARGLWRFWSAAASATPFLAALITAFPALSIGPLLCGLERPALTLARGAAGFAALSRRKAMAASVLAVPRYCGRGGRFGGGAPSLSASAAAAARRRADPGRRDACSGPARGLRGESWTAALTTDTADRRSDFFGEDVAAAAVRVDLE